MDNELLLRVRAEIDDKLSAEMGRITKLTNDMNRALANSGKTVKGFENGFVRSLSNVNKAFSALNVTSLVTFGALGVGFKKVISDSAEFEYQIKKVQSVSGDSFNSIKKNAEEMSLKYGVSVKEITEANYNLVSAMGDVEGKQLILNRTLMLAKAGFTDYAGVITLTSGIMNAYGMSTNDVIGLTDKLITAQNKGVLTVAQLNSQLGRVIPTASALKVSLDEVLGTYTLLTSKGQSVEQATTGLDASLRELGNANSVVYKSFLRLTGETFPDFIARGGELSDAIKIIGDDAVNSGKRINDAFSDSSAKGAVSTIYANIGQYKSNVNDIRNSNGTLEGSYELLSKTASESFKKLTQAIANLGRQIGDKLLPIVTKVTDKLTDPNFQKDAVENAEKVGNGFASAFAWAYENWKLLIGAIGTAKFGPGIYKLFQILKPSQGNGSGAVLSNVVKIQEATKALEKYKREYLDLIKQVGKGNKHNFSDYIGHNARTQLAIDIKTKAKELKYASDYLNKLLKVDAKPSITQSIANTLNNVKQLMTNAFNGLKQMGKDLSNTLGITIGTGVAGGIKSAIINTLKTAIPVSIPIALGVYVASFTDGNEQVSFEEKWGTKSGSDRYEERAKREEEERLIAEKKARDLKNHIEMTKQYNDLRRAGIQTQNEEMDEIRTRLSEFQAKTRDIYNGIPELTSAMGLDKEDVLKEKLSRVNRLIQEGLSIGANNSSSAEFNKLVGERVVLEGAIAQETKSAEIRKQLEDERKKLNEFIASIQKDTYGIIKTSDIFGWTEDAKLQAEADMYTSKLKEMIENGWDKDRPELFAEIQAKLHGVQFKQDEKYEKEEANKREEERLKRTLEEQENAYKESIDKVKSFGDSIYKVGDALENDFIKSIGGVINSLSVLLSSVGGENGKGGLLGSLSGLMSGAGGLSGGLSSLGTMAGLSSALGVAGAVVGVVSSVGSMLGASKKKDEAKIEKRNEEQKALYQQNLGVMKELTETIKSNTDTLKGMADTLLGNLSKNPTVGRIMKAQEASGKMIDAVIGNASFSDLHAIEKGKKKTGKWYNRGSKSTYTDITISDQELLKAAGIQNVASIENLTFDQLKEFSKTIDSWNTNTIKNLTGKNLTESTIDELKVQIKEHINQVELLKKEQAELFKASTLESFSGVQYLDEKELREQYEEQYKELGLDVGAYKDVIDELVEANQVLITSMDGVRESIIGGNGFMESMTSYFKDIMTNVSSVLYDTLFSDLDMYFTDAFKVISDKLVDWKQNGGALNPEEIFGGFDWSKLMDGVNLQKEMEKQIESMRAYLVSMGISDTIIDSILGADEKWEKLKGFLQNAMSSAIDSNKFSDFSKSLGESLYGNVKDSLIKAFSESSVYKKLIEKFMPDMDNIFDGVDSAEGAFGVIQDYLKQFEHLLQGNGLGFDHIGKDDNISANDAKLDGYYTEDVREIKIEIVQNFNGSFYSENVMYDISKKGTYDALEELKTNGQVLGVF